MNNPAKYLALVLSSLTLLACGGGGGDSSNSGTSSGVFGGIIGGGASSGGDASSGVGVISGGVNGVANGTQGAAGSTSGGGTSNGGVSGVSDPTQGSAGSTSGGGGSGGVTSNGGTSSSGTNSGGVSGVPNATQGAASPGTPVASTSLASVELAKYEGVWQQGCVNHMRRTTTLVATSANVFTVTPQENLFANADCTGAIVATGSFGKAQETVQYRASLPDVSVKLLDGTIIQTSVDPATSTLSIASFTFTGSGVRRTLFIEGGKTLTTIAYASGDVVIVRDAVNGGTAEGGLALRNGELLALVPVAGATTSFLVNQRFVR